MAVSNTKSITQKLLQYEPTPNNPFRFSQITPRLTRILHLTYPHMIIPTPSMGLELRLERRRRQVAAVGLKLLRDKLCPLYKVRGQTKVFLRSLACLLILVRWARFGLAH